MYLYTNTLYYVEYLYIFGVSSYWNLNEVNSACRKGKYDENYSNI